MDLENLNVSLPSQKFNIDLENLNYTGIPDIKVETQVDESVTSMPKVTKQKPTTSKVADDSISDKEYNDFINNGKVKASRIKSISQKVKNNEPLSNKEIAIYNDKTSEINEELRKIKEEESKVADAEEITEEPIAEEMTVDENTLDKIAEKVFKSRLSIEEYLLQEEDQDTKESILSDIGYIKKKIEELTPKVVNKPTSSTKETTTKSTIETTDLFGLPSFETLDYGGTKATYYKKSGKWGYIDVKGAFVSLIVKAQPVMEAQYKTYLESIKTAKNIDCG